MSIETLEGSAPIDTSAPVEGQPVEPTEAAPEVPKAGEGANRFAFLAKKEAAIVRQRNELKAQMQALESQRSELDKLRQEIESVKGRRSSYKTNPLAALEDAGLSYKELTDFILNNQQISPEQKLKALEEKFEDKISRLEAQREEERKLAEQREAERQAQREQAVIEEFKTEIGSYVAKNKDQFELTHLYDSSDLVYDTVEAYYEQSGKVLSIPEACELVEKYLEKQVEKSLQTKKLSSRLTPKESAEPAEPRANVPAPKRTLNNQNYTSSTPSLVAPKVESDRMARALAALDL